MILERHILNGEREKVDGGPPQPVLPDQVLCRPVNIPFVCVGMMETGSRYASPGDAVVVRDSERVEKIGQHLAPPLDMQRMEQFPGEAVGESERKRPSHGLAVVPPPDRQLPEIALAGNEFYEISSMVLVQNVSLQDSDLLVRPESLPESDGAQLLRCPDKGDEARRQTREASRTSLLGAGRRWRR